MKTRCITALILGVFLTASLPALAGQAEDKAKLIEQFGPGVLRLVILDKGRIVEEGTHDELTAREGGVYAKLLRMQMETQLVMAVPG